MGDDVERFALLQLVRLKGMVSLEDAADALGADAADVLDAVEELVETGEIVRRDGQLRLTGPGRELLAELVERERAGADQPALAALYTEFCKVNDEVKATIAAWQLVGGVPNQHVDRVHDGRVLARLRAANKDAAGVLERIEACVPRFGRYRPRLARALERARDGDHRYVAQPLMDSYHTVWFELHEDLLGLCGRTRADEAAAGRSG